MAKNGTKFTTTSSIVDLKSHSMAHTAPVL